MNIYQGKTVLVTGGSGLIGRQLIDLLLEQGAKVRVADVAKKPDFPHGVVYLERDLTHMDNCIEACEDVDYIFHLAGIKGSPRKTKVRPADFFVPMLQFNTNMLEAARLEGVERFLYTSSIAVLDPEMDKFPAWAKRTGEMQIEAYRIQHKLPNLTIVRPANVFGPHDDFNDPDAMVVTSLVRKVSEAGYHLDLWGDGTQERDFIYSKDVARAMLLVMEKNPQHPINIGTGETHSIGELANLLIDIFETKKFIRWSSTHPGTQRKTLATGRLDDLGFKPRYSFKEGLEETVKWFKTQK